MLYEVITIFSDSVTFCSVTTYKGGAKKGDVHGVDAISGSTITSKGVEAMLQDCLEQYKQFFITNKK